MSKYIAIVQGHNQPPIDTPALQWRETGSFSGGNSIRDVYEFALMMQNRHGGSITSIDLSRDRIKHLDEGK